MQNMAYYLRIRDCSSDMCSSDLDSVFEAAGIVRNAPTASESTPRDLEATPPGEWESTEWGATATPRPAREEDELRHVPAHGGDGVAFLPLDDARLSRSLDELVARRAAFLVDYQNAAYAKRYPDFVAKVRAAEQA